MNIPRLTEKQKLIPPLLYKFRYLTVSHFQKLLNYKDPHRIKERLTDLKEKGYIAAVEDKDVTKPFIYCLDTKSKYLLREDEYCDSVVLARLYKEKHKQNAFIDHHLFLASVYLFFDSVKEKNQTLSFFTQQQLKGYEYFPSPRPSAYIVKTGENISRYFLEVFDPYTPAFVLRNRVRYYLQYSREGQWQANTNNSPFPAIMFICPNLSLKNHIYMYSKALLNKSFSNEIDLFLTTRETIEVNKDEIWQKVG